MCSRCCLDGRCALDWDGVLFNLGEKIVRHLENPQDSCGVNKAFTAIIFVFMRKTFPRVIRGKCNDFQIILSEMNKNSKARVSLQNEPFVREFVAAINDGAM